MPSNVRNARLGVPHGAAMFIGAVLGPGVLALPQLAAAAAGPASILAWVLLLLFSVPVAFTFARLGAAFPGGGGVATFAEVAFSTRAAAVVGWWFYAAVPVGILAAAYIGAGYVSHALGLGRPATVLLAAVLLAAAFAANHAGLRVSGGLQLVLAGVLAVLLVGVVVTAAPDARAEAFTPFAPAGWYGVASAIGVLFFAFAGWEAISSLSGEFSGRHLWVATAIALIAVTVLYLALAVTTIAVLGDGAARTPVPLTALLESGIDSGAARLLTAVAAIFLSFGPINTYIASGARLGAALADRGDLPRMLAGRGGTPHRSIAVLAILTSGMLIVSVAFTLDLDALMRAPSACLAMVTLAGAGAAVRLLRGRNRLVALAAAAFAGVITASCGAYLLVPVALAVLGTAAKDTSRSP